MPCLSGRNGKATLPPHAEASAAGERHDHATSSDPRRRRLRGARPAARRATGERAGGGPADVDPLDLEVLALGGGGFRQRTAVFRARGLNVASTATDRGVNIDALLSGRRRHPARRGDADDARPVQRRPSRCSPAWSTSTPPRRRRRRRRQALGVNEASPVAAKIAALEGLKLGTTGPGAAPDALFRCCSRLGGLDPNRDAG